MTKKNAGKSSPFLNEVRRTIRLRQLSYATEKSYIGWIKRYVRWSGVKHPKDLDPSYVKEFLTDLATKHCVAATTQNQAFNALVFLYRHVLSNDLSNLNDIPRAHRPRNLPTVLTRDEIRSILSELEGTSWLVVSLLYGSGLRMAECLGIRIKDIEVSQRQITIRQSKGFKDRVVVMPEKLIPHIERQIEFVTSIYHADMKAKRSGCSIPDSLRRKYKNLPRSLGWYYFFPARNYSIDPRSNMSFRHHIYPDTIRRNIKTAAVKGGINKHLRAHSFRHSYATHSLEDGVDIRTLQTLLGHKDVRTTMIYTHVIDRGALAAKSPLDRL